jgi:hypothetical protein
MSLNAAWQTMFFTYPFVTIRIAGPGDRALYIGLDVYCQFMELCRSGILGLSDLIRILCPKSGVEEKR